MRKTQIAALVALAVALGISTVPALAHHSMVADYDVRTLTTLNGTITKMEWINPHGWVHIDVKGADGQTQSWAIETGSPFQLMRRGLAVTDFMPGTQVIVAAFAAKDGSRTAAGWVITFVDRTASSDEEGFTGGEKSLGQESSYALGR